MAERYYSISPHAYVANNPLRFVDPTGKSIWDFLYGVADAVVSNLSLGTLENQNNQSGVNDTGHYNSGRTVGDIFSVVMGLGEMVAGAGGKLGH